MRAGRRLLALAGCAAAASTLGACGFTPLYGDGGVAAPLAGVAVVTPDHSRTGYLLREQLNDELGRDLDHPPAYRLVTQLSQYRVPLGVRVNNVANRYEIGITVNWRLQDAATGAVLTRGTSAGRVSYDSADAPYGGVAAEQDGEDRAASQVAVAIRFALSRWFAKHPAPAA